MVVGEGAVVGSRAVVMNDVPDWAVVGVDPSIAGISQANRNFPELALSQGAAAGDLIERFGRCPVVLSLEVVEYSFELESDAISKIGERGAVLVKNSYNWHMIGQKMAAVYNWMVGKGDPPECMRFG